MKSGTINDTQVVSHHVVLNENITSIIVISMEKTLMFEFYCISSVTSNLSNHGNVLYFSPWVAELKFLIRVTFAVFSISISVYMTVVLISGQLHGHIVLHG